MAAPCDPDFEALLRNLPALLGQTDRLAHSVNQLSPDRERLSAVAPELRHSGRCRFSPGLAYGRHFGPPLPSARQAAVMILLEPRQEGWTIPLTVRPQHLPDHAGQVCLPGGRLEVGETHAMAAAREFCEELGLDHFPANILGPLQGLYVFNSDFHLIPYLAVTRTALAYRPAPSEVAQVVHLPVAHLLNPAQAIQRKHVRGSVCWSALGIDVAGQHIWGATAMVLGELAELLRPLFSASDT